MTTAVQQAPQVGILVCAYYTKVGIRGTLLDPTWCRRTHSPLSRFCGSTRAGAVGLERVSRTYHSIARLQGPLLGTGSSQVCYADWILVEQSIFDSDRSVPKYTGNTWSTGKAKIQIGQVVFKSGFLYGKLRTTGVFKRSRQLGQLLRYSKQQQLFYPLPYCTRRLQKKSARKKKI